MSLSSLVKEEKEKKTTVNYILYIGTRRKKYQGKIIKRRKKILC
jgi:hypothetical protein